MGSVLRAEHGQTSCLIQHHHRSMTLGNEHDSKRWSKGIPMHCDAKGARLPLRDGIMGSNDQLCYAMVLQGH